MKIRKGPYGYFAVERLGDSPKMCDYAFEVIDSSEEDILLPVYINRTFDGNELAFEFSDLISIDDYQSGDHKKDDKHLSMRRKSIGNLFLSIQHLLDLLINPALMITDPKYVYTNPDGTIIKVCLLPVESDKPLKLSSMDPKAFETLLSHEFFREAISETEASSIVYAASSNNEQMMIDEANKIISTPVAKASYRFSPFVRITSSYHARLSFGIRSPVA